MSNRKQRRQQRRQAGKLQGETFAEALARKKNTMEACRQAAYDQTLDIKAEIRVQRVLWMCCVAMNRAFGIGPSRFRQFAAELDEVSRWYESNKMKGRGDEDYANEMLRREASKCAGMEVSSLYEDEMIEAVAESYRPKTQGDRIRAMTDGELAEQIFQAWETSIGAVPFRDLSAEWCRGEELCGETDCTDEKNRACISAWLGSPLADTRNDETEKGSDCH